MLGQVAGQGALRDTGGHSAVFSPRGGCCMVQSARLGCGHVLIGGTLAPGL